MDLTFQSSELEVGFFKFNAFLDPSTKGPPALITPEDVISQACRVRIMYRPPRITDDVRDEEGTQVIWVWVTVGLSRVSRLHLRLKAWHQSVTSRILSLYNFAGRAAVSMAARGWDQLVVLNITCYSLFLGNLIALKLKSMKTFISSKSRALLSNIDGCVPPTSWIILSSSDYDFLGIPGCIHPSWDPNICSLNYCNYTFVSLLRALQKLIYTSVLTRIIQS